MDRILIRPEAGIPAQQISASNRIDTLQKVTNSLLVNVDIPIDTKD